MDKKTLERWLDVLNYWFEHIEDMGDRYPDMQPMVNEFDKVINEIYNLTKGE
jgi:general stress protein 26